MSTTSPQRRDPWSEAVAHLRRADPAMSALMDRVGPCLLRPKRERERFTMLVRSIVGQQISAKAAAAINHRLHTLAGLTYTPGGLLAVGEEELRSVGVSRVKAGTILN